MVAGTTMRHLSVRTLFTTMTAAAHLASMDSGSMAVKRVLVTGGAGYIGSHTCLELIKAGEKVREGDEQDSLVTHSPACMRAIVVGSSSLDSGLVPVREYRSADKFSRPSQSNHDDCDRKKNVGGDTITT